VIEQRKGQALVQAGIQNAVFRPEMPGNPGEANSGKPRQYLPTIQLSASHLISSLTRNPSWVKSKPGSLFLDQKVKIIICVPVLFKRHD
jgi:hypothetical protein